MKLHEREALREKSSQANAKRADRLSRIVRDREESGRLMVDVHRKVPFTNASRIGSDGKCRHEMIADSCGLCRSLQGYKPESRYITIAKRKLGAGEVSAVKERGWQGVPHGIPVGNYPNSQRVRRYKQIAITQPKRLPIGEESPTSKPVIFPSLRTVGGTRKQTKKESTDMRMEEALAGLVNHTAVAQTPRIIVSADGLQYCPWFPPKVLVQETFIPQNTQSWTSLEIIERRSARRIAQRV